VRPGSVVLKNRKKTPRRDRTPAGKSGRCVAHLLILQHRRSYRQAVDGNEIGLRDDGGSPYRAGREEAITRRIEEVSRSAKLSRSSGGAGSRIAAG